MTEVILVHFNIINNNYQRDSTVLYAFVPNKSFGQMLNISPTNFNFQKTFNSEMNELKYSLRIKILMR